MDMDQAAVFLAGSILTAMGFIVVVIGVLVINNLLHKYWKPITIFTWAHQVEPSRFMTHEEAAKIAPHLEEETNGKSKEKRNA